jgi:hypothetical protein
MATKKQLVRVDVPADSIYGSGYVAEIVPGTSIRIAGVYTNHVKGPQPFDRTFKLGDAAERKSFSLHYVGHTHRHRAEDRHDQGRLAQEDIAPEPRRVHLA